MKKFLLFSFAMLFALAAMAQNRSILINESFNGGTMPTGWSIAGAGTGNWSISSTNNAGGSPNELMMSWSPQFNGTSRVVSPAVDLTGIDNVMFMFKHALNNYSGSHVIGIATSSDNGATWNSGWNQSYGSSNTWSVMQQISTSDMGKENVRFCIYYTGNSYNMNYWYFDDIQVFTVENLDLGINACNVPNFIGCGDFEFAVDVFNYGSSTITSVEATYDVDGVGSVTETFDTNIPSLGASTLTFSIPTAFIPGPYNVTFSIDKVNGVEDDAPENDTFSKSFAVAISTAEKIPMIEHFSSSTCGPCVSVNTQMLTFCNNNVGRFTYTKYQMNWPGSGDPYYTNEGGIRQTYYGVNAVPDCIIDGEDLGSIAVSQNVFNQHAQRDAFMDIRGSFSVDGNTIHVLVDVMPYVDIDARIYVSVNEKVTHNNVGGNGETSFHHIFMKMLPNGQGTTVSFANSELQHLEFTQDMSTTHVEEMSDLEVSIWVQHYASKEVFNSRFAYEYTDVHPYPVENLTMVDNEAKDNTMLVSWDAPANGSPIGYNVYINGEPMLENTTETSYAFTADPDVYYVAGVTALYADDKTSVTAVVAEPEVLEDHGLITDTPIVQLDENNAAAELTVNNGNYSTLTPIELLSITEAENENGIQYLVITAEQLPYTLEVGDRYSFRIEPNYPMDGKSTVNTFVLVESDAGTLEFLVEIDGELLSVTELTEETSIYPNPTSSNFTIEGANVEKVEIYNLAGQKIFEQQGNKVVNIDASGWNKGLYLVSITNQNGATETRKLLVK